MGSELREINVAMKSDDRELATRLCDQYLPVLAKTGGVQRLFRYAVSADRIWAMEMLLERGANVNEPLDEATNQGSLYEAAAVGATKSVQWLLQHGALVNLAIEGEERSLPLFTAIRQGYVDIVRQLVESGASLRTTWNGQTPLECAMAFKQSDIASYLSSISAKWRAVDHDRDGSVREFEMGRRGTTT